MGAASLLGHVAGNIGYDLWTVADEAFWEAAEMLTELGQFCWFSYNTNDLEIESK
jgi:hypothetical protein